jgi:hypothetical protein
VAENLYRLEIESLDLGPGIRAVGLELLDPGTREPVTGAEAGRIWAAAVVALATGEPWSLDFFAHLERVREFCRLQELPFREPNDHALVIAGSDLVGSGTVDLGQEKFAALLERFAGETFGARAGVPVATGDAALEGRLAERGVDAYEGVFRNYLFCGVFDIENGFLTLLSERLWASEVMRRVRGALTGLHVEVTRPPE